MVGGVEDGGVGVFGQVVGEVGGDGGQYLVEDPGPAGVPRDAGGAGLGGSGLALLAEPAVPGQLRPDPLGHIEPPEDDLGQAGLQAGVGVQGLLVTTEWRRSPLQA